MTAKKKRAQEYTGKIIKKIRTDKKIALTQMANETGFSIDNIKRIESGEKHPSVGELLQISKALEIDSSFLLRDQASSIDRAKAFTDRTEDYAYTTLTPGAENKHLKAFRVSIEALQEHKGVSYQHEGEEFIYVLKGHIEVTVGDHVNNLGWGESLHFNSAINHKLKNIGTADAELLVVIYTP
ncbi:MAG: helix-turn-helix transcriptional regulator [Deltaproteobacteria bacterium]|nr:helix-turn-helix transcriptional regulator [Deltaproteobacteria bacterium]